MALFEELKRRNVLRVAAAYIAVSWLLIQVVGTLFPAFGVSDSAIRAVVIVLALGFIPAVAFAWAFEITPEGVVRDDGTDDSSRRAKRSRRRLDLLALVALLLAVGYFALDKFILDPVRDETRDLEGARGALADFPGDREPGYFGVTDGMSAELTTYFLI